MSVSSGMSIAWNSVALKSSGLVIQGGGLHVGRTINFSVEESRYRQQSLAQCGGDISAVGSHAREESDQRADRQQHGKENQFQRLECHRIHQNAAAGFDDRTGGGDQSVTQQQTDDAA